ncbi:unnamed protein product [Xylocopa violacea]|uniref:DUF4795 domain-containing protein n=1 Tax=Xylocopa violacea TaxID=135666 RepID=A0ABP1NUW8_XYLVO
MAAKTTRSPPTSPAADKEVASLQVSLPQMLDLALGTPEVGAVNLNILHNFLHVVLHQINLGSTKVEYRGDDANRIKTMVSSLKAGPSLYLQEYCIIDESTNGKESVRPAEALSAKVDVVIDEKTDMKKTKGSRQKIGPGTEGECETVIFVEPIVDGATPTALGFKRLEQIVNELQQRFQALEELATTPELIERLKGKITDPLTDVWQIISITKRLDASEQGIDKLTKMVQDVIKGDATLATVDTSHLEERLDNLESALSNLDHVVKNLQIIANAEEDETELSVAVEIGEVGGDEHPHPTKRISLSELLGGVDVKEMRDDVDLLKQKVAETKAELKRLDDRVIRATTEFTEHIESRQEIAYIEPKSPPTPKSPTDEAKHDTETESIQPEERQETVEPEKPKGTPKESPKHPTKAKTGQETIDSKELQVIQERISKLEKDVTCLFEKVESAPMAGVTGTADIDDLGSKIHEIQTEMEKLNQTADRLIDDRENREMHLNALLEQVELLKTIKADREDLEDALADKADAQAINRKVSYDQFDAACDDLAQGLEEAISKLGQQEAIWQEALEEVQKEIEGKVDKMEMSPLKDFVNNRLKLLQEKLKKVAEAREQLEAAGTKKLLTDVQCISCDKDVVMRMDGGQKFKVATLPCTMSMKPYLTYELDQVRKQHRRLPHSRNMIQFEAAMQEEAKKQKSARAETLVKTPRDHLCNRYCGGSHTVTTPQQRVMRVGHFLTQWGPEIVQLTEGMIKGTDGKMYKGRRVPEKFDVCGPSYCSDHGDEVRISDRPSTGSTPSRKAPEKHPPATPKKRTSKRRSREISKEVIEEVPETPVGEMEDQEYVEVSVDTGRPPERVRYIEEEEMGEQDD